MDKALCRPATIADMADALVAAYTGGPIPPIDHGGRDLDPVTAHAVRAATVEHWTRAGRRIAGRKIGLTSAALRIRLGAPEPTDGFLFADTETPNEGIIEFAGLFQPLVEVEIALILDRTVTQLPDNPAALRSAIRGIATAIEIVDSRIQDWRINYADAIADNGSAAGFVISGETKLSEDHDDFAWDLIVDGKNRNMSSGTAHLDVVLKDFHWLAGKAISIGAPLQEGEIILSGSLGGAVPVSLGDVVTGRIAGLGQCTVLFR
ncbi:MAG: 4-oxalocrotonate decarboxylase [Sphingomonadales bacterium]|nr:4-oxalocrotonate decarboxylase [Sphingomonadales bacterium]